MFFKRKNNYFDCIVEVIDRDGSIIRTFTEPDDQDKGVLWWLIQWWKNRHNAVEAEKYKLIVLAKLWLAALTVLRVLALIVFIPLAVAVVIAGIVLVLAVVVLLILTVLVKFVFERFYHRDAH